jgi:non-specific serine/threonine protein kinase
MLETIRAYALEQLSSSGETDVIRPQHAAYYLALAEEVEAMLQGAEQGVGLVRLETEHDNLLAVLEWGKEEQAGVEYGLRLAAALWRFWEAHGHLSLGRAWLEGFPPGEHRCISRCARAGADRGRCADVPAG